MNEVDPVYFEPAVMSGVMEYNEGRNVCLVWDMGRVCVRATNAGGADSTSVDIKQLIAWLREHEPQLLEES